jgi:DNA repair exonuclease SbcCD nuclease subunit
MILFTADWHIKLGQKNVPKQWALDRYRSFFDQVHQLESECSLHIIGGDIFDRVPSLEELELYFEFVSGVSIPTIIYDGNHEATRKNKTFFTFLKNATYRLNPNCTVVDTSSTCFEYSILPYCDLHVKGGIENITKDLPLFTHVRGEIPPHVKPEVDLSRFDDFPIVYAGDLHAHSNTQRNIVYPGSPMTTSFHRSEVTTGYILIDAKDMTKWEWKQFELPQLIRKTVQDPDDMIATPYHHTIYELEGDMQDLADTKNSELLDKKVIKRSSEAALVLDPEMTIQEELAEYLLYILELSEEKVQDIVGTFNDHSKTA